MNKEPVYRVLVVDDEDRLRQVVRRVLEPQGYLMFEAPEGRTGMDLVEREKPDLVLVDLMMPVMDGMEFIAEAKRAHPDLICVVITGYATLEKAVEAMKQGADDFLAKPFKPQELTLVVDRAMKKVRTVMDMALERSRTRLLVETMTNGVLVVDTESRVALMNPALRSFMDLGGEDPLGMPLAGILPCPEVRDALLEILAGGRRPGRIECAPPPHSSCKPLQMQVDCLPFLDSRGNMVGAVAVFDDVSALKALDELKSEYISTVAHEIASPLSSVLSQLQILTKGMAGGPLNPGQAQLVDRVRERVQGIISLSKDLLDLSKIEAGTLGEPERLDVGPLLHEAVDVMSDRAREKGQDLLLDLEADLPPVSGVPAELLEVFTNLVSNAVRYTPKNGTVRVAARSGTPGLVVEVKDNGFGIAPEEQEKIFQRFYRVKDANTRQIVGTGLGLPIVKRVVESHGGRVELDSAPGRGSTFRVILPRCAV